MRPATQRVLTEGLVAGLIGYGATVLFFGALNLFTGRSFFYTAAVLGSQLTASPDTGVTAGAVFAYNGIHVLLFLLLGMIAAWAVLMTERNPALFPLFMLLALGSFFLALLALSTLTIATGAGLSWWSIAAANAIAGLLMAVWLLKAHPRLWGEIRAHSDPESEGPVPTA